MNHFLRHIEIANFKSIRRQTIEDCRRINIFIGYPNVGKSNLLEALGLFSLPYLKVASRKKLTEFIRVENLPELFYEAETKSEFLVNLNHSEQICKGHYDRTTAFPLQCKYEGIQEETIYFNDVLKARFEGNKLVATGDFPAIKKYKFSTEGGKPPKRYFPFLLPPTGANIFKLVTEDFSSLEQDAKSKIHQFIQEEIGRSNGEFLLDKGDEKARILKRIENGAYSIPYTSIADTLQRLIFYKTAILSNKNSVIILEEPEAHMFPPYIRQLTWDIIKAETNQVFLATHSPFVLGNLMEEAPDDVAVYLVSLKEGETEVQRLSDEMLSEVREWGVDLFFNLENYLVNG